MEKKKKGEAAHQHQLCSGFVYVSVISRWDHKKKKRRQKKNEGDIDKSFNILPA